MHSDYQSVKEQSGIFAGDGGYTIDIAGHSHLEGGLVTSTRQAESQGLNRFKTGTLSYGDIANHANYRGSAMSMEAQITLAGQGGPKKVGNQQLLDVAKYAGESQRALGVGQTRDSQQSTTRSGINTANLEITDMARQQMQLNYQTAPAIQMNSGITVGNPHPVKRDNPVSLQAHLAGIKTDTDTQTVAQQAQALTNRFDKDKVQRELDFQVNTTKQFGQTLAEAKRQTKAHLLTNASEQTKQYVDWAFDTLGAGLTTGSVQAAGVAAVSPFANRTIKQLTTDRQTGETNLVTNTLAHAALGALEAKATGNNAAAGAMAGASSELAAPLIAKALYGTDDPKQLTEVQKQNIVNLSSLAGAIGAGIANGNGSGTEVLTSANQGAEIGKRAVENNYLSIADVQNFIRELSKAQKEGRDTKPILEKYKGIGEENRQQLIACKGNVACETAHLHEMNTGAEELERNLGFFSRMTVYYPNDLNTANRIALSNLVESENAESFSKLSDTTKFGLNAMEAGTAIGLGAAAGYAKVGLSKVKSLINGKDKAYPTSGMDGYKRANVGDEDYRSSGAENAALYPKLKEELAMKQKAGFEKVVKDLSKKPTGSVLMIPDYRHQLSEARSTLSPKLQRSGNAAVAQINIDGLTTRKLVGHSQIDKAQGSFVGQGETKFESLKLPNKKGDLIDRRVDSEYKILSNLADQLGSNRQAKGQVTIFTERPACLSCLGVVDQFTKRYPNIKVNVFDNNGKAIKHNGEK